MPVTAVIVEKWGQKHQISSYIVAENKVDLTGKGRRPRSVLVMSIKLWPGCEQMLSFNIHTRAVICTDQDRTIAA